MSHLDEQGVKILLNSVQKEISKIESKPLYSLQFAGIKKAENSEIEYIYLFLKNNKTNICDDEILRFIVDDVFLYHTKSEEGEHLEYDFDIFKVDVSSPAIVEIHLADRIKYRSNINVLVTGHISHCKETISTSFSVVDANLFTSLDEKSFEVKDGALKIRQQVLDEAGEQYVPLFDDIDKTSGLEIDEARTLSIDSAKLTPKWENIKSKPDTFKSTWEEVDNKPEEFESKWDLIKDKPFSSVDAAHLKLEDDKLSLDVSSISYEDLSDTPDLEDLKINWENVESAPESYPSTWSEVTDKPFETIDETYFSLGLDNKLVLNKDAISYESISDKPEYFDSTWNKVEDKPFESVDTEFFKTDDNTLSLDLAAVSGEVADFKWDNIQGKPETFPADWEEIKGRPFAGIDEKYFSATDVSNLTFRPAAIEFSELSEIPEHFDTTWDKVENKPEVFPTNWDSISGKPDFSTSGTPSSVDWQSVQNKPFTTVNRQDFDQTALDRDELAINKDGFRILWGNIQDPPFTGVDSKYFVCTDVTPLSFIPSAISFNEISDVPEVFDTDWEHVDGKPEPISSNDVTSLVNWLSGVE